MATITGNTFQNTITRFPIQSSLTEDAQGGWIRSDDAGGGVVYFGFAGVGSSEDAAVWKIRRETTVSSDVTVEYADGDLNFDNVWTDRASLSYS